MTIKTFDKREGGDYRQVSAVKKPGRYGKRVAMSTWSQLWSKLDQSLTACPCLKRSKEHLKVFSSPAV